ncbi:hypothetical protein F4801DRAFT_465303 [Xylaria longipes]|nr:hypothetical protein F4801DRAFT_465303 [Xylaria longipes]
MDILRVAFERTLERILDFLARLVLTRRSPSESTTPQSSPRKSWRRSAPAPHPYDEFMWLFLMAIAYILAGIMNMTEQAEPYQRKEQRHSEILRMAVRHHEEAMDLEEKHIRELKLLILRLRAKRGPRPGQAFWGVDRSKGGIDVVDESGGSGKIGNFSGQGGACLRSTRRVSVPDPYHAIPAVELLQCPRGRWVARRLH